MPKRSASPSRPRPRLALPLRTALADLGHAFGVGLGVMAAEKRIHFVIEDNVTFAPRFRSSVSEYPRPVPYINSTATFSFAFLDARQSQPACGFV